jgi:predicted anti-sigma-YlaC factor YlaD
MNCTHCEEQLSDYLENALSAADSDAMDLHLQSCAVCRELLAGIKQVLEWGRTFPVYEPPAWLASRIIANTPRIARESWLDTVVAVWKWVVEPRTAMAVFTATLVLGWLGSIAGISPDWATVVRDPSAIYYKAQGAMNRAYDEAIRRYYRSPLVTEIQTRIEQLREIS